MIAGAADLISRRGVCATSLRDVVQHTGTPRGSLTHYFPGGKPQMLEEALRYATEAVAEPLQALMNEKGPIDGLQAFVGWWRRVLETSNFESGCPVLAVAVEPLTDADESADRLRELASAAFMRWQSVLVEALYREGVPTERAQRLGVLVVASSFTRCTHLQGGRHAHARVCMVWLDVAGECACRRGDPAEYRSQ